MSQLDCPSQSFGQVSQVVGLTEVSVDYSSPAVKRPSNLGRSGAVRSDVATGANQATKDQLQQGLVFAGKPVPAGTYALFTIPPGRVDRWCFNKKADSVGTGRDYKADRIWLRVKVQTKGRAFP